MITLIDGSNMLHRSMWNADNKLGIHPLREIYIRFLNANPDHTIIVWDGKNSLKRRRDLYPAYKRRPEKAEDISASFDIIKEVLCHCPVMQIEIDGWEADDVLYTLAHYFNKIGQPVTIETNDQDFWQLASLEGIKLPMVKQLPCLPNQTTLYKALIGDKSDTIPGWKGFGPARWEAMCQFSDEIEKCLQTEDWEGWNKLPWPKGVSVTQESFFQCCIFYKIVTMQEVPEQEFEDCYIVGKAEPALAEEIFARWRI